MTILLTRLTQATIMTRLASKSVRNILIAVAGLAVILFVFSANIAPFHAFGGVVWLKSGAHYISDTEVSDRVKKIDAPYEAKMAASIEQSTPSCGTIDEGFCQESSQEYAYKTLVSPAVAAVPAVPDKKVITGYCTLCNDGTFSPSCAVGRGACSWHGGVNAYSVAEYRTIAGTPAVPAQPAVYNYAQKSYKDSPSYMPPTTPSLSAIVSLTK